MIVRFDAKALSDSLNSPLGSGVGVTSASNPKSDGEVSEVDNIIAEARKSMGDVANTSGEVASLKEEAEREAEEEEKDKESGPEVDEAGLRNATERKKSVA